MVNLPSLHEEGFLVSVRVNLNEDNFQSFEKLKNQLSVYSGINVYPARITGPHVGNISKEKFSCIEESAISSFTGTSCMASQAYNLGISQNGMISKCWEHITNENNVVGHVSNLEMAKTGFIDDYSPAKDPDCSQCHVLPTCWGGCRAYNKFFERGYISKNYDGCSYAKWNIREKVLNLYQNAVRKKV
jgi:radical SAM protein with 4Fe4S-binding SPASM domain